MPTLDRLSELFRAAYEESLVDTHFYPGYFKISKFKDSILWEALEEYDQQQKDKNKLTPIGLRSLIKNIDNG